MEPVVNPVYNYDENIKGSKNGQYEKKSAKKVIENQFHKCFVLNDDLKKDRKNYRVEDCQLSKRQCFAVLLPIPVKQKQPIDIPNLSNELFNVF